MPKELLKITNIKDSVCQAESHCSNQAEREFLAAALISLMDQDKELAETISQYVTFFILKRNQVSKINQLAMKIGKIKTQN